MVEWKEYRIKDLGEVVTGNTPPTSNREYYGTEYKFIKPTDMVEGQRFVSTTEEYYSELAYQKYKKCLLPPKTPCVVTIGSLGKKMCLTDTECFTNQAVNAVIPNKENDGEFLYYAFKASVLAYVKQLDSGTTSGRENVSKSSFSKIKVRVPPLPTQQKIASILSAYDNLIQNYKKQIEALQTAASELYKEWFVRFRFPGYQNTKFENGIPEGWKVARLKDIAKDVGKTITKNEINYEKDVYIPIDCIPNHNMALTEVSDIENAESSLQRFESGDILFGAMRVYFHKVILAPMQGVTRKTCFVIHAKKDIFHNYLYSLLFSNTTINYANTISVGATMPYVRWNDFIRMQCLFPSEKILNDYNKIISPIFKTIMNSYKYLSNLTQQRDLLLPRLMSGKLEVK